jgi:hypothetical protein
MIIELSRFNSFTSNSNSDWTNSFQPITIQPQGSLSLKSAFLDYNTSSEQVIELLEDVNIVIETAFYVTAPPTQDGLKVADPDLYVPLDLYICRNKDISNTLTTSTRSFTIPAGNYSPQEITEIINFNCVSYEPPIHGDGSFFNNAASNNFFRPTTDRFNSVALEIIPKDSDTGKATLIARNPSDLQYFEIGDYVSFIDIGLLDGETTGNIDAAYTITALDHATGEITVNPDFLRLENYTMTNPYMYHYVYVAQEPDDKDIDTTFCFEFYRQGLANRPFNNTTRWLFDPNNDRITNYMGASQFQLEYNNNQNALFQFTYLHTPYYSNGDEAIMLQTCGYKFNNIFRYMNTLTGVFFTKLEPASFWEGTLGFDLDTVVVTESPEYVLSAPLQVGVNITGNLVSYDALFDKTNAPRMYPADDDRKALIVNAVSTQTQPIVATKPQQAQSSSFYLIELGGLSDINMINDTDLFRTICAIGSKEYNSQGIISIYPDGSAFYTNNGFEPIYLSSLRVRILDSITKQPTSSLGGKNSVFIQLTNPPPQPQKEDDSKSNKNKK